MRKLSQEQPATSQRSTKQKKHTHKTCRTRQTSSSQRWHHVHKQLSIDLDNIATHKKITKQRHQAFTAVTEDTISAKCGGGQVVPRLIKFSRHNTRTKTGLWTLDLRPIQTRFVKQKGGSVEMPYLQELSTVGASRIPAVGSSRLGGPLNAAAPSHSKTNNSKVTHKKSL